MIVARQIIQTVRQISSVMKKEVSVIRDKSSFPEYQQAQFRQEECERGVAAAGVQAAYQAGGQRVELS
jgi:hypothetical protein